MAEFRHPPLKRHPALQPLSRDHYLGLVQAQHLVRAADGDEEARRRVAGEFAEAWRADIKEHFLDEERLLGPLMDEADRARLVGEHAELRRLAGEAEVATTGGGRPAPDAEWLRRGGGETLRAHIRWEERELFPRIEARVSEEQLANLSRETERIEASRNRSLGSRREA